MGPWRCESRSHVGTRVEVPCGDKILDQKYWVCGIDRSLQAKSAITPNYYPKYESYAIEKRNNPIKSIYCIPPSERFERICIFSERFWLEDFFLKSIDLKIERIYFWQQMRCNPSRPIRLSTSISLASPLLGFLLTLPPYFHTRSLGALRCPLGTAQPPVLCALRSLRLCDPRW